MNKSKLLGKHVILCMLAVAIWAKDASALEIKVPPLTAKSGQSIEIPILVDEVDKLAGVKLVLTYDPEMLTYKKGAKSKEMDSLMHIVNDKKPGILILVMAGAKGVKGKDFPIFTLTFDVKKGLQQNQTTKISITESQLMGDDLKEMKCSIVTHPVAVTP